MTSPIPIRVLLVEDSAAVCSAIARVLGEANDVTVTSSAPNGARALDALRHVEVDVVLLDVEMPDMDGIATLPLILAAHPGVRVIVTGSPTQPGGELTVLALALGATDAIAMPPDWADASALAAVSQELLAKVRSVGRNTRVNIDPPTYAMRGPLPPASTRVTAPSGLDVTPRVLALAASTGGPNALAELLSALPRDFPLPILITQHMPPVFTALLAERLQRDAGRPCVEATNGMPVRRGVTHVAPGDWHMIVHAEEGEPTLRLERSPPEHHCRPAADPMLRSIAAVYGAGTLAVVLTGMGEDGRRGCAAVRERGGCVIVQDEESSVVWGMPGAVASAGLAQWILPLREIAATITAVCSVDAG